MKKWKIGNKLLATLLPIVVLTIGATTWVAYTMSQQAILKQQTGNLELLVNTTVQTLDVWMMDRVRESKMFSKNGVFIDAVQEKRIEECQERLRTYQQESTGYENLFVALPTGEIIYDSIGGKSVGINISKLPGFAINFEKAVQGITWVGKVNASPATGRPVTLITSPLTDAGRFAGIFGSPLELNDFSDSFVGKVKVGQKGYLFLIDSDGRILAHPDKNMILKVNIKDFDFGRELLTRKQGIMDYTYQGQNMIAFFYTDPQTNWTVVACANKDEFWAPVVTIRNFSILLGVASVLLVFLVVWFRSRSISKPLERTVENLNEIAEGDLSRDIESANLARGDEIGLLAGGLQKVILSQRERVELAQAIARGNLNIDVVQASERDTLGQALKEMVISLGSIIDNTNQAIEQVASSAREVSNSSQALSKGASEQAAALEEITSSMTELSAQTLTNAENAGEANAVAKAARDSAEAGNQQMEDMIEAMGGINQASREIAKIIKTIDDIAFQTNLLALNAAVEAARAGKHGKGFAVVAQEVRNLAARSAKAARETAELIEGTVKKIQNGTEMLNRTGSSLAEIVGGITKVTNFVVDIAAASNQQAQGISQVKQGLYQIEHVTQQNTATAEESASAADELSSQAAFLADLMIHFKVSGQKTQVRKAARKAKPGVRLLPPKKIGTNSEEGWPTSKETSIGQVIGPKDAVALDDKDFRKF